MPTCFVVVAETGEAHFGIYQARTGTLLLDKTMMGGRCAAVDNREIGRLADTGSRSAQCIYGHDVVCRAHPSLVTWEDHPKGRRRLGCKEEAISQYILDLLSDEVVKCVFGNTIPTYLHHLAVWVRICVVVDCGGKIPSKTKSVVA